MHILSVSNCVGCNTSKYVLRFNNFVIESKIPVYYHRSSMLGLFSSHTIRLISSQSALMRCIIILKLTLRFSLTRGYLTLFSQDVACICCFAFVLSVPPVSSSVIQSPDSTAPVFTVLHRNWPPSSHPYTVNGWTYRTLTLRGRQINIFQTTQRRRCWEGEEVELLNY